MCTELPQYLGSASLKTAFGWETGGIFDCGLIDTIDYYKNVKREASEVPGDRHPGKSEIPCASSTAPGRDFR